jgi:hypothetical protein
MATSVTITEIRAPWPLYQRIAFRFAFLYLGLFCTPIPGQGSVFEVIPHIGDSLGDHLGLPLATLALWTGRHLFHLQGDAASWQFTGSGDTALHWVTYFCIFALALVGTLIWSVADRHRTNYNTAMAWLHILLRFTLAFAMLDYGFSKIYPRQFISPSPDVLSETYGASTPMRLLWVMMGSSPLYRIAAGAAEVAAGFLLMFRRTATTGALLAAAVMANVALLNFAYDVPVKLYSAHLCLAALFLLIPDLRAIFRFLIQRREAALSKPWLPEFKNSTVRRAARILHAIVILFALLTHGVGVYESIPHDPRYKSDRFPLTTHRFHWISPSPDNH